MFDIPLWGLAAGAIYVLVAALFMLMTLNELARKYPRGGGNRAIGMAMSIVWPLTVLILLISAIVVGAMMTGSGTTEPRRPRSRKLSDALISDVDVHEVEEGLHGGCSQGPGQDAVALGYRNELRS